VRLRICLRRVRWLRIRRLRNRLRERLGFSNGSWWWRWSIGWRSRWCIGWRSRWCISWSCGCVVWRRWRGSVRIGKPSHGLMHTRVLLELVHGDSILHAIHGLSVGQTERISINPVDELHGVDELKPVNETSEGLFAKPGIRINLLVVFKYILVVIQSLDNSIEEVVDSNLLDMAVLRRSKPHSLQCCQSGATIQASTPCHRRDYLTKVDGFSHGHSHQLRQHSRVQPTSHTTHTSHSSQQLLHISSLARSAVLPHL